MFEPVGGTEVEKQTSGKAFRIIGIVMAVLAVVLLVISFA